MARTTAPKTLDVVLVAERERRGHTQTDAAETVGVRQATWNRWEHGQSAAPDPDYYEPLMRYLRVNRTEFALMLMETQEKWRQRRTRPRQNLLPR